MTARVVVVRSMWYILDPLDKNCRLYADNTTAKLCIYNTCLVFVRLTYCIFINYITKYLVKEQKKIKKQLIQLCKTAYIFTSYVIVLSTISFPNTSAEQHLLTGLLSIPNNDKSWKSAK